jgi:hypothetical protein
VELSPSETLPLPSGDWDQASCFPWVASCLAHQEAALAALLKSLLCCSVAALLGQGPEAVNSSCPGGPSASLPSPSAFPRPPGVACLKTSRDPKKTKYYCLHPLNDLLPLPPEPGPQVNTGEVQVQRDVTPIQNNYNNNSCP